MHSRIKYVAALLLALQSLPSVAAEHDSVSFMHWWVSS